MVKYYLILALHKLRKLNTVSVNVAVEWVSSLRHFREFPFQISISIPVFLSVVFRSFRYPLQANARISPCSKPRPLFPASFPIHVTDNSAIRHYVGLTWGTGSVYMNHKYNKCSAVCLRASKLQNLVLGWLGGCITCCGTNLSLVRIVAASRKMKWPYCTCGERRDAYWVLVGTPKGTRPVGTPAVWVTNCTAHSTHHSLKHFLPQHCWTFNDVFLLITSTKL
jgi:hypothetical protein